MSHVIQRAFRLQQLGKLELAAEAFGAVIAADPDHFDAHEQLGVLRFQQGRYAEALSHLDAAAKLKPERRRRAVQPWARAGHARAHEGGASGL